MLARQSGLGYHIALTPRGRLGARACVSDGRSLARCHGVTSLAGASISSLHYLSWTSIDVRDPCSGLYAAREAQRVL